MGVCPGAVAADGVVAGVAAGAVAVDAGAGVRGAGLAGGGEGAVCAAALTPVPASRMPSVPAIIRVEAG